MGRASLPCPHSHVVDEVVGPGLPHSYPWGLLNCAPIIRVSSVVLPKNSEEPTLPSAVGGEGQGQLSCSHDPRVPTAVDEW